jgi:hypothetical protein
VIAGDDINTHLVFGDGCHADTPLQFKIED